jgi:hypothetical protein
MKIRSIRPGARCSVQRLRRRQFAISAPTDRAKRGPMVLEIVELSSGSGSE